MKNLFVSITVLISFAICAGTFSAQSSSTRSNGVQAKPVNLDFENGMIGTTPDGWSSPTNGRGYQADLTEVSPMTGRRAAILKSLPDAPGDTGTFGNLMQTIDTAAYRGKRVRFRAAVKVEAQQPSGGRQSFLWMRVDRSGGQTGFLDSMSDRPIHAGGDWRFYEIVGLVDEDATIISIGMGFRGRGTAYLDSATLEEFGKPIALAEPAPAFRSRSRKFNRLHSTSRLRSSFSSERRSGWRRLGSVRA